MSLIFKQGKQEDSGNYRPASHTSIPRKVREQLISETISRHTKDKKVIRSIHQGHLDTLDQLEKLLR